MKKILRFMLFLRNFWFCFHILKEFALPQAQLNKLLKNYHTLSRSNYGHIEHHDVFECALNPQLFLLSLVNRWNSVYEHM